MRPQQLQVVQPYQPYLHPWHPLVQPVELAVEELIGFHFSFWLSLRKEKSVIQAEDSQAAVRLCEATCNSNLIHSSTPM